MKRIIALGSFGVAILTILFALALPIKVMPLFLSGVGALDLKVAPWFSGGVVAFVLDRGAYQVKVYRPVYPALVGEGEQGFVQLVWEPRSVLPAKVQDSIDLDRDGTVDCELSFSNLAEEKEGPRLTVIPKSAWVLPVHNSRTTSLSEILIEKGGSAIFVRIPVRKLRPS